MRSNALLSAAVLAAVLSPTAAFAHASLEVQAAPAGSYKAVMRIPHGCDGQPTHTVRIELPEGFISAKPMPKPGWTLETETGDYGGTYSDHGREVTSGGLSVTWSGGALLDEHYDEFVVSGTLAGVEPGEVLAFPTTQICADGEVVWDEIAEEGQDPHGLASPAPTLTVAASAGAAGHHHDHGAEAASHGTVELGDLAISGFWTRATLPGQRVGGGYMTIENAGAEDDRLVAIASPVTERGEIHEMAVVDDVMTMRRLDNGLAVPAGGSVELEPGGYHLMFQDLEEGFVEGGSVPVTLTFEKAGEVTLELPVMAAGSRDGGHDHQHHQH
jgi:periplasmic copper chaperone A